MKPHFTVRITAAGTALLLAFANVGIVPVSAETVIPAPEFSQESGFYADSFALRLTAPEGFTVYYTLDGSDPTADSQQYQAPITVYDRTPEENIYAAVKDVDVGYIPPEEPVDKAMIVRAAAADAAGHFSETVTKTYFIGYSESDYLMKIPVISLVTDPANLFDPQKGIYIDGSDDNPNGGFLPNFMREGKEWERSAHFTVFENGTAAYSAEIGIRIHGNSSRYSPQKSFSFYSRKEYGTKRIKYDFFDGARKDIDGNVLESVNHVVVRNGGNDQHLKIRDRLNQEMAAGLRCGTQAQHECILFLDGEYWGLYNITEKVNESYVADHYHISKDDVLLMKNLPVPEDDIGGLLDLYALSQRVWSEEDPYDLFAERMDMGSFADYAAVELIVGNIDCGYNNYALWKSKTIDPANPYADGRWRFVLYDTEYGQGLFGMSEPDQSVFEELQSRGGGILDILFTLLQYSPRFRTEFAAAYLRICGENYNSGRVLSRMDELWLAYREPLTETYARFRFNTYDSYDLADLSYEEALTKLCTVLQNFWEKRPEYAAAQSIQQLQLYIIIGDVNGDGITGAADAALLRDWLLGNPDAVLTEWCAADMNTDGKLDAADLTLLQQMLL
ncbi:MAG: CotH kinase family protein [Oscillospiraceae bacterium]|nr:CotH kinase family protein [Oscillospiraceae bacterium]